MIPRFALHKLKNAIERQRAELKLSNRRYAVAQRFKEAKKREEQKKKLQENWLLNQIDLNMFTQTSAIEEFSISDANSMLKELKGTQYEPRKQKTKDFADLGTAVVVYRVDPVWIFITFSKRDDKATILVGYDFNVKGANDNVEAIAMKYFPDAYYAVVNIGRTPDGITQVMFPIDSGWENPDYDFDLFVFDFDEFVFDFDELSKDDITIYRPANKTYKSR